MNIYIIGCGGVGSWLTPSLALLTSSKSITLIDGDALETKNLNRQLFNKKHVGQNKAEALASLYGCKFISQWYSPGILRHEPEDWLMVCVDNNPARIAALQACDEFGCRAILAANETHSSEAYLYNPTWKGSDRDPRVYYPELVTVTDGDPVRRGAGCTGEAQRENVQLVSANFMAAALAQHLFVLWAMEVPKMNDPEMTDLLPYKFGANLSKLETFKPRMEYAQSNVGSVGACG